MIWHRLRSQRRMRIAMVHMPQRLTFAHGASRIGNEMKVEASGRDNNIIGAAPLGY
jgi:hypothetical protein